MYKAAESWIRIAFYLRDKNRGHVIQELIYIAYSCCIVSQTFIISYLTFQSSNFKTLIKKNEKSARFKNFHQFRGFALHYESLESAESWENLAILADKRLDYFLTEFKLISNLQNQQKTGSR